MTLMEELKEITIGQKIMVTLCLDGTNSKATYLIMVTSNEHNNNNKDYYWGCISGKFVSAKDGSIDDLNKSWVPIGAFLHKECIALTILHDDCDLGI